MTALGRSGSALKVPVWPAGVLKPRALRGCPPGPFHPVVEPLPATGLGLAGYKWADLEDAGINGPASAEGFAAGGRAILQDDGSGTGDVDGDVVGRRVDVGGGGRREF